LGRSSLGDLIVSWTGAASSNCSVGLAIGCSEHATEVLSDRTAVAEGAVAPPWSQRRQGSADLPRRRLVLIATA